MLCCYFGVLFVMENFSLGVLGYFFERIDSQVFGFSFQFDELERVIELEFWDLVFRFVV